MTARVTGGAAGTAGQDSTRRQILMLLRRHGRLSAPQLAAHLGLSPVGVRRHLLTLERDGLVSAQTERSARGRPAARYALTDSGRQTFPKHYDELAQAALSFLDAAGGRALHDFLAWRNDRLAADYGARLTGAGVDDRARELADALTDHGYMAEVEQDADGLKLCQHNCTVEHIATEHPDVCEWEAALFARLLGATVTRESTIVDGSARCVARVRTPADAAPDKGRRQGARRTGPIADPAPAPTGPPAPSLKDAGGARVGAAPHHPDGGPRTGAARRAENLNDNAAAPRQGARRPEGATPDGD